MHLRLKFTMKLWDSVIAASNLVLQCCKENQSLFSFMMLNSKFEKGGPNANDISGDELAGPVFSKWLCPLCWQVLFSCYSSKAKQGYHDHPPCLARPAWSSLPRAQKKGALFSATRFSAVPMFLPSLPPCELLLQVFHEVVRATVQGVGTGKGWDVGTGKGWDVGRQM